MKIQENIKKIQALPETKKKIIFFAVIIITATILIFITIKPTKDNIARIQQSAQSINLPPLDIPKNDFPAIPDLSGLTGDVDGSFSAQTAGWKTYTSEKYGFEIKYPPNYEVEEDISNRKILVKTLEKTTAYPFLAIEFLSGDYVKIQSSEYSKSPDEVNNIIIDGVPAKEFLYYDEIGTTSQVIILLRNNQIIQVNSFKGGVLDPMISTFKFTSSNI